jgi:hypothetical protein
VSPGGEEIAVLTASRRAAPISIKIHGSVLSRRAPTAPRAAPRHEVAHRDINNPGCRPRTCTEGRGRSGKNTTRDSAKADSQFCKYRLSARTLPSSVNTVRPRDYFLDYSFRPSARSIRTVRPRVSVRLVRPRVCVRPLRYPVRYTLVSTVTRRRSRIARPQRS